MSQVVTRWLPIATLLAVVVYYFWFLLHYALDIPYQDEIYDVLGFLSELVQSENWRTSLQLFFIKWNEHSTASARLVYFLSYRLFGGINFVTLTALANTALPVFIGLLYWRLRGLANRWLILLPTVFIMFNFRSYYTALWSMTAFAYFYVLVYGFCCLYCLHNLTRLRLLCAVVFGALATFSLASGQLVWLAGLLGVAHQAFITKSISRWYVAAWILAAAAVLMIWHSSSWGRPDMHFEYLRHLTAAEAEVFAANAAAAMDKPLSATLLIQLKFFLAMLGGVVSDSSVVLASASGSVFLLACALFIATAWRGSDLRLELCCIYILLTVAAMAHGRAELVVLAEALNSRFSVPSAMLLCILWVLFAVRLRLQNIVVLYLAALLAGAHLVRAYAVYSEEVVAHHDRLAHFYNRDIFWLLGEPAKETARVVAHAREQGIYTGPDRPIVLADPSGKIKQRKPSGWPK